MTSKGYEEVDCHVERIVSGTFHSALFSKGDELPEKYPDVD